MMKLKISLSIFSLFFGLLPAFSAEASVSQCLGHPGAFEKNILSVMHEDGYKSVSLSAIRQIGFDDHDPEFDVIVGDRLVRVECDDSGDDDCQCQIPGSSL